MLDHGDSVKLRMGDDEERELGREKVIAAAHRITNDEDGAPFALIDKRRVPALPLVAAALDVDVDKLRPAQALAALREFDIELVAPREFPADLDDSAEKDDIVRFGPELERALSRLRGHWVALRSGQIVADDVDLAAVLGNIGTASSTVLFVPKTGVIAPPDGR